MKKSIFITGASSGIGRATAIKFANGGEYDLILCSRRQGKLEQLKEEISLISSSEVHLLNLDVRDENSVIDVISRNSELFSRLDVLVNNAGLARGLSLFHESNSTHINEMIDTNVKGLLYVTKAVLPYMLKRGNGHIINICSTAGKDVYKMGTVYCASKFAVDAITKGLRQEYFDKGIRIGQVSPGHVEETEFAKVRFDGNEEKAKIYEDFNPLTSRDVADAIYYMVNSPAHVNIQDMYLMSSQQGSATLVNRSGRIHDQ